MQSSILKVWPIAFHMMMKRLKEFLTQKPITYVTWNSINWWTISEFVALPCCKILAIRSASPWGLFLLYWRLARTHEKISALMSLVRKTSSTMSVEDNIKAISSPYWESATRTLTWAIWGWLWRFCSKAKIPLCMKFAGWLSDIISGYYLHDISTLCLPCFTGLDKSIGTWAPLVTSCHVEK